MSKDDFDRYLTEAEQIEAGQLKKLGVDVPPSLPQIDRRSPPVLGRPPRPIGLGAPLEVEPTGAVWQSRVVLGIMIAAGSLFCLVAVLSGDWIIFLLTVPLFGLMLVGGWRSYQAELAASKKKKARQARRLRDLNK